MDRLTQRHESGEAYVLLYASPTDNLRISKEVVDKQKMVIERLAAYEDTGLTPEEIMDGKMLTGWIPCSDRLPETSGRYLVSRTDYDGVNDKIVHFVEVLDFNLYSELDIEFWKTDVDAWQPLPEPWEGDKE